MRGHDRPEILIGYDDEKKKQLSEEVILGIEEEGCLFHRYCMKDKHDIRYSAANVTVVITGTQGGIYLNDVRKDMCLYNIECTKSEDFRQLGMNAARYLKGRILKL